MQDSWTLRVACATALLMLCSATARLRGWRGGRPGPAARSDADARRRADARCAGTPRPDRGRGPRAPRAPAAASRPPSAATISPSTFPPSARASARTRSDNVRAARSLSDALEGEPGILVQKTGPLQHSPFIRGFTAYHNLLLIDGIRLNHSAMRSGPNQYWSTVDPLSLRGLGHRARPPLGAVRQRCDRRHAQRAHATARVLRTGLPRRRRRPTCATPRPRTPRSRGSKSKATTTSSGFFAGFGYKHYGDIVSGRWTPAGHRGHQRVEPRPALRLEAQPVDDRHRPLAAHATDRRAAHRAHRGQRLVRGHGGRQ